MPRPLRVEFAGACYHVINRGNYRRRLFEGEGAAEAFERTLGEAAERFGWRIHAYVVMSNHFHLAVEIAEPNLSEGMGTSERRQVLTLDKTTSPRWRIEACRGRCESSLPGRVINRGNYRRRLFDGEGAAAAFERALGEAAERFGWRIHAYVVMSNHFHLAAEIVEPNLSAGMKWLQGTWIRRYNGFRRLIGRPFQGRYKALLIEPGHALGQVCHYIQLNPVRAGLVAPDKAATYPWGSLPRWPKADRPVWLEPATLLHEAGELRDTAAGWKRYNAYLEFLATDEPSRRELVAEKLSRGWCVGTRDFKQEPGQRGQADNC